MKPMAPSQSVVTIIRSIYMLRSLPKSRHGMTVATMMMTPPIVGTPFFSTP